MTQYFHKKFQYIDYMHKNNEPQLVQKKCGGLSKRWRVKI